MTQPPKEREGSGPAFPVPDGEACDAGEYGLSKRDYIAIAAMQGMISNHDLYNEPKFVAETSYRYADAMIAARSTVKEGEDG